MKLLLSNDDGVFASGIRVLAETLSKTHEIYVSAPDAERSGVSRSMTLFEPLRAKPTKIEGLPEIPAYAVSGTPVDCVRLALGNLFPAPDLVVSGINLGPNLGTDVLYSGTVAAAHEAPQLGYQAIAITRFRTKANFWKPPRACRNCGRVCPRTPDGFWHAAQHQRAGIPMKNSWESRSRQPA
jgi:5'-nucleotidase